MKEETEQKTLPASEKKLRDARRKGMVSHSRDLISGFSLLIIVFYLFLTWPLMRDRLLQLVETVSLSPGQPFVQSWGRALDLAFTNLLLAIVPLVALIFAASVIAGIAGTYGPVFSFEPVKPKFQHINPVQGLKRIFSLRNAVEFLKGMAKVVVLAGAFWLVLRGWLQQLFEIPSCGERCLTPMVVAIVKPIAVTAVIAFLLIGLFDLLLQRWLFLREMRMTRTEYKRERKDLEGDPLIRSERSRQRRRLAALQTRTGLQHAVFAVAYGDDIVGLRYVRGETVIPVVVSKGRGETGAQMVKSAIRLGIPIIEDADLAPEMVRRHTVGEGVQREFFQAMARILVAQNLV